MKLSRISHITPRTKQKELMRAVSMGLAVSAAGGAGSFAYARFIEPWWVEMRDVGLTLPRLPVQFHGYKIAQVSDLHMEWMGPGRLAQFVGLVNGQQPDLVAVTGDFVTRAYEGVAGEIAPCLRELTARDGSVAVLGNHDYWGPLGAGPVRQTISESALIDLNNDVHTVERDGARLHIAGLDSVREGRHRTEKVLAKLPKVSAKSAAILVVHEPDFADRAARLGIFDLQISGHSHGGQVVVPMLGPPRLPPMGRKYPAGLYRVGEMWEYTNRGLGMTGLPVRFFCRPEITIFTLQSPGAASGG